MNAFLFSLNEVQLITEATSSLDGAIGEDLKRAWALLDAFRRFERNPTSKTVYQDLKSALLLYSIYLKR